LICSIAIVKVIPSFSEFSLVELQLSGFCPLSSDRELICERIMSTADSKVISFLSLMTVTIVSYLSIGTSPRSRVVSAWLSEYPSFCARSLLIVESSFEHSFLTATGLVGSYFSSKAAKV